MKLLSTRAVFSIGDRTYCWGDVILAAVLWGEWAEMEGDVRRGLALLKYAEETGTLPPERDVSLAVKEFRYEHNLITGEESRTWLETWGLTLNDWRNYFRSSLLRQRPTGDPAELSARYQGADVEVARWLTAEGVCSGRLSRWARRLAGRAAVFERELGDAARVADEGGAGRPSA
jgi:hypothetical protein